MRAIVRVRTVARTHPVALCSLSHASSFSSSSRVPLPTLDRPLQRTLRPSQLTTSLRSLSTGLAPELETEDALEREERLAEQAEVDALSTALEADQTSELPPPYVPRQRVPPVKKAPDVPVPPRPINTYGGPTLVDLEYMRPRRLTVPLIDSEPAVRVVYTKKFDQTLNNIDRSFNKVQLRRLIGPASLGGLGLDMSDRRLSTQGGRPQKNMKPKVIAKMSKKELIRAVMILHWGMPSPDKLPSSRRAPQIVEKIALTDRTLFLLLVPEGTSISSLTLDYNIKLSFSRDKETSVLSIILTGGAESVAAAKEALEELAEGTHSAAFELPLPATTMRPEVYQTISRLSKVFLEQGPEPDILLATASDSDSLSIVERSLSAAFVHHQIETGSPLFGSFAPVETRDAYNPVANTYSMYPFSPTVPPSWLTTPSTSFARVRSVHLTDSVTPTTSTPLECASKEYKAWSNKMQFERPTMTPFDSRIPKILPYLRKAFKEGQRVEMRGEFGHVLWPLFTENRLDKGLEPVLDGEWPFSRLIKWRAAQAGRDSVFVPSPPANFLGSTGVLTLPSQARASPFDALHATPLNPEITLSSLPLVTGNNQRRLVYRPVELPELGLGLESIEIDFTRDGGFGKSVTRKVKIESRVLVPDGGTDFSISLTSSKEVETNEIEDFPVKEPTLPPYYITYDTRQFQLDADQSLRTTQIIPPIYSPTSQFSNYPSTQERWHDGLHGNEGSRTEVRLGSSDNELGEMSDLWRSACAEMEARSRGALGSLGGERKAGRGI